MTTKHSQVLDTIYGKDTPSNHSEVALLAPRTADFKHPCHKMQQQFTCANKTTEVGKLLPALATKLNTSSQLVSQKFYSRREQWKYRRGDTTRYKVAGKDACRNATTALSIIAVKK